MSFLDLTLIPVVQCKIQASIVMVNQIYRLKEIKTRDMIE